MGLVSKAIPSLFNGISQQPASLRSPTQAELQENAFSSIVEGLKKRPPTQHVAKVQDTTSTDAHIHLINRDVNERYVILIMNGDLKVYALADGSSRTVNFPNGTDYLNATTPRSDFRCVTVADYTFVVNTSVTVAMSSTVDAGTYKGTKQKFSDLPSDGTQATGDVWEIAGDPTNEFDNYYVSWTGSVWQECVAPGLKNSFDNTTMPHTLIRQADGSFTFDVVQWDKREVGDTLSCEEPSFIGKTIADVFFYRNRLGFLADEAVVMSRAGEFFNFWPKTVTAVLDSDPVDVAVSHVKVSILKHGVPFNKALLLFSDQTQFQLSAGDLLSPKTVRLDQVTEFESSSKAKPVGAGQDLYFIMEKGGWSGVREYFVDSQALTNDAADVTAHCPRYVPADVFSLSASSNEDIVLALTMQERNAVYVYKFYWSGSDKLQSSWSKWTLAEGDTILGMDMITSTIYLVVQRADGVYIEKIDLQVGATDDGMNFLVHLDRKVQLTGSYDSTSNKTTWTLPYADDGDFSAVLGSSFSGQVGASLKTSRPSSTTISANGDYSSGSVFIGRNYNMRYRFSEQFVPADNNTVVATGRLKLRTFTVLYNKTGYFKSVVTPAYRDTSTHIYTGKTLGAGSLLLGSVSIDDGKYSFPVGASSEHTVIELQNDSYLPCFFQSVEWEGQFTLRSKRI